jgi:hypothetical protein
MRHLIHTNSVNHASNGQFDCQHVAVDGMRLATVQRLRLYLRGFSDALQSGRDFSGPQLGLFARLMFGSKRRSGWSRPMQCRETLLLSWEHITCFLLAGVASCGLVTRPGVSCSFLARD